MAVEYREEPCRSALNRVNGMPLVAVGAATDPYQPAEGRYRLTRGCLEALAHARNPLSLITRGPMIVRDVDVLQAASRRAAVDVNFSIPTLDPEIWRKTEPGTLYARPYLEAGDAEPVRAEVAALRARYGIADRRRDRLEPPPDPEQLSLAV
jgi:hypothetical protein